MSIEWIDVKNKLPNIPVGEMRRYRAIVSEGSMAPHFYEREISGKQYVWGFTFIEGDWIKVLYWREIDET